MRSTITYVAQDAVAQVVPNAIKVPSRVGRGFDESQVSMGPILLKIVKVVWIGSFATARCRQPPPEFIKGKPILPGCRRMFRTSFKGIMRVLRGLQFSRHRVSAFNRTKVSARLIGWENEANQEGRTDEATCVRYR